MEISRKSNFRFKAIIIALLTTMLMSTCGTAFAATIDLLNLKPADEPFLNRTVTFTGPTHWRSDGQGRKISILKKGEELQIKDSGTYEGVITLIDPRDVTYKYYILGKGWIAESQIQTAKRFVTLQVGADKVDGGFKGTGYIKVDGEYLNIESTDAAVVRIDKENKAIVAEAAGNATIKIDKKDGETLELLAVVVGDPNADKDLGGLKLELKVAEDNMSGTLSATLDKATVDVWNKTATLNASGKAEATLAIDKNGKINLKASGEGEADLQFKGKEVAKIEANGDITAVVDPKALTADVTANATEKLTILEKLTVALKEKGHIEADKDHIKVDGEASAEAGKDGQTTEIGAVNGQVSYTKGDTDPKGMLGARLFGKEFSTGEKDIPIVSGLKALIGKIR